MSLVLLTLKSILLPFPLRGERRKLGRFGLDALRRAGGGGWGVGKGVVC